MSSRSPDRPGNWTLATELPVSFVIRNSPGVFTIGNEDVLEFGRRESGRRLIAIDQNLCATYLPGIINTFATTKSILKW